MDGNVYLIVPTIRPEIAWETVGEIGSCAGRDFVSLIIYDRAESGFVKTCNRGLRKALAAKNVSCVAILNEDISIKQHGWLSRLEFVLSIREEYGAVSPSGMCRTQPICYGEPGDLGIATVRQLPMFCTLIKASVFQEIGLLDEGFIHYGGDSDFFERMIRAGYHLIWDRETFVENKLTPVREEWKEHDRALFEKKWGW